ncbi:MAG TPA: DUF4232 domain-containing protein [Streptosporangiaceae bacterium]|jgi:hypothetical protein
MKLSTRAARRLTAVAGAAAATILLPAAALALPASPAAPSGAASHAYAVTASTGSHPARPAIPACETPGLVIWLNTNGNAAAGSTFFHLEFTNLSGHACTLNGFPFIQAVNLRGQQVGRRASFTGKPHTVRLANHQTVKAVLQIVDAFNFPPAKCHRVVAAGLKVFPPNQTRAKTAPFPFQACSTRGSHAPVFLTVRPVTKGA